MYASVERVQVAPGQRLLAVSDVHGNIGAFDRLLERAGFCERDLLVVAGDFLEKGPENLRMLRRAMALAGRGNARFLRGNCDDTIRELLRTDEYDAYFLPYVRGRKSLIGEMCVEAGIPLEGEPDLPALKAELNRRYAAELDWLCGLPVILDTPRYVFVHAGLGPGPLNRQPLEVALETYDFMLDAPRLDKTVVVGHEPTVNYEPARQCYNPKHDLERRVLAIDGGNVIKRFGQLNLVALPDAEGEAFEFWADDDLPPGVAAEDQRENAGSVNIRWGSDAVTVLEEGGEFSFCEHQATGRRLWIPNSMIRPAKDGGHCASNATDYRLPVRAGDRVSVAERWSDRYLAKRDGVVGWVMGRPLALSGE